MILTNCPQSQDKQNINSQNQTAPLQPKKKIAKSSLGSSRHTKNSRTVQAIKTLTQQLKHRIMSPPLGQITLSSQNKQQDFPIYDDTQAVHQATSLRHLLKQKTMDNDVDSEEQHLCICVEYMREQVLEAASGLGARATVGSQQL